MREIVLRRALNPTQRAERLVQVNPSLAMRTLQHQVAGGRQTALQQWQGSRRALGVVKKEIVREGVEVVEESREGLLLFSSERATGMAAAIERALGPETLAGFELAAEGATWRILTRPETRVPAFLAAVREMEESTERQEGAAIPRYARVGAAGPAPPPRLLTPRERAVLAQADKLGYFAQPRRNGIAEVGKALKMPASTALYHLRAAQRKLVSDALRG